MDGYQHQCYLGFSSGKWWSSHTLPEACGFRAHPGWLALKLRNRYAPGETMLATVHNQQPTIQTDGEDIPLISSYALTDGDTVSVFLLSRKLDGVHDSIDFDETTGAEAGGLPPGSINLYVFSPVDDSTCILDSESERSMRHNYNFWQFVTG